jgi:hypothetical protein
MGRWIKVGETAAKGKLLALVLTLGSTVAGSVR